MSGIESRSDECHAFIEIVLTRIFDLKKAKGKNVKLTQNHIAYLFDRTQPWVSENLKRYKANKPIYAARDPPSPTAIESDIQDILETSNQEHEALSIHQVQAELNSRPGHVLNRSGQVASKSTIYRIAKRHHFTSKKISRVRFPNDVAMNASRSKSADQLLEEVCAQGRCTIIAVDEMSISARRTGEGARGFSLVGEEAFSSATVAISGLRNNASLIVFTSEEKLEFVYVVEDERVTAAIFDVALDHFLGTRRRDEHIHFILDNARTHLGPMAEVVDTYNGTVSCSYMPAYTPDANPAEYVIKRLRDEISRFLSSRKTTDPEVTWKGLLAHLERFHVDPSICANAFKHAFVVLRKLVDRPYPDAVKRTRR